MTKSDSDTQVSNPETDIEKLAEVIATVTKTTQATEKNNNNTAPAAAPGGGRGNASKPFSAFRARQKWAIVGLASMAALFAPMSSNIYVPSIPEVSRDFNKSTQDINLTLTIYLVFQAITPSFFAGLSDTVGRRPVLQVSLLVYCLACIGIALTPNSDYWLLLLLRCIQAAGGSPPIGTGSGAMGDIATPAERGTYMSLFSGVAMIGPAFGPVIGGIIVQWLSWRWIFWVLAIWSGVNLLCVFIWMPETLRSIVGDGSIPPPVLNARPGDLRCIAERKDIIENDERAEEAQLAPRKKYNPIMSFPMLLYPEVALVVVFGGIVFGCVFAVLTVYSTLLEDKYGFDEVKVGLCYLAQGGGSLISGIFGGRLIDWQFRREKCRLDFQPKHPRDLDGFPIERVRFTFQFYLLPVFLAALIGFGWAMETHAHIAVALVMNFFIGICNQFTMQTCSCILVDMFAPRAGAVIAASNIVRCTFCAVISAVIDPLMRAVGVGWAFVILGGFVLATAPCVVLLQIKGPEWRKKRKKEWGPPPGGRR